MQTAELKQHLILVALALSVVILGGSRGRLLANSASPFAVAYCCGAPVALPPAELIPTSLGKVKIDSYSFFLVCNPKWLSPAYDGDLRELHQKMLNFGLTIGDNHAAVWFVKSNKIPPKDAQIADVFDIERSVRFCQAWKLKPSSGPHLVVTSSYPNEEHLSSGLPENSAVFSLGDMSPKQISDLLTSLTDQLILQGHVASETRNIVSSSTAETNVAWWVQLLEVTQKKINNFGCAWSFKIDAGSVKAELHPQCQS